MKEAENKHRSNIGIAHTRRATHGSKNEINAHPHQDLKKRIALVHNGFIENFNNLKEEYLFETKD